MRGSEASVSRDRGGGVMLFARRQRSGLFFFQKTFFSCHAPREKTGGLVLSTLEGSATRFRRRVAIAFGRVDGFGWFGRDSVRSEHERGFTRYAPRSGGDEGT
jgi:hypothetical protein